MKSKFKNLPPLAAAVLALELAAPGLLAPKAWAGSGCDTPPSGLVSWWQAEDNAMDRVGGNNGALANNAGYGAGEVGFAFAFTNALAAVQLGNATNLQLQNFTIEAWIQRKSATNVTFDPSGTAEIFGFGSQGYALGMQSNGSLFLTKNDVDGTDASPGVTDTNFHHIAVTKSGVNVVFYVDGVARFSESYGSTFQFSSPAAIGARGDTLAGGFYGLIDEMSIYNRALLASEIVGIFNAGSAGKCPVPAILTEPASQSVSVGAQVQLSIVAQSTNSLSYQWMLDGTNLPPATNSTLTLTNVQLAQAGSYFVTVSNFYGVVTSATAVVTVSIAPVCLPPPANLVSWWPGEGNANDVIGANSGVLVGNVTYAQGEVGRGFLFSAAGEGVNVGAAPGLQLQNFTIECWIRRSSSTVVSTDTANSGGGVLFAYDTGGYGFYLLPGGQLALSYIGYDGISSTTAVTDTALHHVAMTTSSGAVVFYLDGVAYPYGTYSRTYTFTSQASIGAVGGTQNLSFNGLIDEMSIYSRALTATEIQSIYTNGADGKCLTLSIAAQPTNRTVYVGSTAIFTVQATGRPPLLYQWSFGTTNLPSATNSSLTLTNVQASQAGSYSVTVNNPDGSLLSSKAVLTVNPSPACLPAPANLVAWWRAEGNTLDELGAINGAVTGNVTYAPGEVGQGFLFGGLGASVNLGYATNLQLQTFTIEAWIQRTSTTIVSQDPQGDGQLLCFGNNGYGFYLSGSGSELGLTWVGNSGILSTATVTDTSLHHVAVTKLGTSVIFYLDGVAYNVAPYTPIFSFGSPVAIGARGDTAGNSFDGLIDEMAVYNRVLAPAEIQSIYTNGPGGKCAVAYSPVLVSVPASQSLLVHGSTSLLVSAAGSVPLAYQWRLDGTNLPGATNPVLPLANIQISQAGSYSVIVSNSVTNITSTNAVVSLTFPVAPVKVISTNAVAGSLVTVLVTLTANGNENSLGFSLNFTPATLSYAGVTLGAGAAGASLSDNTNFIAGGEVGIAVNLPYGSTFNSTTDEVVRVSFLVAPVTNASSSTAITFGGVPVPEQLADPFFNALPATYANGSVTITGLTNFEGDVNGDVRLTLTDWLEEGQFVAQVASATSASQFQRADCAPRSSLGDGALTVIDWVQAGRYALGLDPLTAAGGPSVASGSGTPAPPSGSRLLMVNSPAAQMGEGAVNVGISLAAQGNENAAGFTLSFPPSNFRFNSAVLGAGGSGGTLILNTNQVTLGILAAVLALPPGGSFAAGIQQLLSVNLNLVGTNSGSSPLALTSQLVKCEVSDPLANPLPLSLVNGTVTVNPIPSLAIALMGSNVVLSWPLGASNFLLQSASGGLPPFVPWSNSAASVTASTSNFVTLPLTNAVQFFRLELP